MRRVEKIFVDVKNIWTDHAADDAKHDGSQPKEHKLRVGPALNIKLQNIKFQLFQFSYLLYVFRKNYHYVTLFRRQKSSLGESAA